MSRCSSESQREQLIDAINDWASLYGRKLKEGAVQRWLEIFENTEPNVLAIALQNVTKNSERMPTPGALTKAINAVWDSPPPGSEPPQRYHYDPNCKLCLGTGWHVVSAPYVEERYKQAKPCECRGEEVEFKGPKMKPAQGFDPETGEPVNIMVDMRTGEHLYKAKDCPEGREFIAHLRSGNGKH